MLNPIQQTSMLNQEMKNPHLVETMVTIEPITGRKIQNGYSHTEWVSNIGDGSKEWKIYQEKMSGQIPRIELTFNIQGIPLILTAQSYLTLRITPKLIENQILLDSITGAALETDYEIDRSGWPKLNSQVIDKVQATISNMGTEAYYGFYLNYIRSLKLPTDLRENMSRQFNDNYCAPTVNTLITDREENNYQTLEYRSRAGKNDFLYACSLERTGLKTIQWTSDNTFEIKIPLAEILPVFQIPVLPIAQTNTSGIQLRMVIFSPKHLFYMSRSFKTNLIWNNFSSNHINYVGLRSGEAPLAPSYEIGARDGVPYNGILLHNSSITGVEYSGPSTLLGYDRRLIETIDPKTMITSVENDFFACDIETEAFLNLKVLSNPLLNPLAEAYIQPFINEMNEFRAKFENSALYNQTIVLHPNTPTIFRFTPNRLFYNATQIGLFFFSQTKRWNISDFTGFLANLQIAISKPINSLFTELDTLAGPIHGYYTLPPTVGITNFQIGLSSSATPLFDRPLDKVGMLSATEDCFKKYNPTEMYGKVVQNRKRLSEGDAFFLFDLTHTRDSGYFIDADNLITVGGTLTYNRLVERDFTNIVASSLPSINENVSLQPPEDETNEPQTVSVSSSVSTSTNPPNPPSLSTAESLTVQVIMVVFYQETFTVLLDLEGAVLFQQT